MEGLSFKVEPLLVFGHGEKYACLVSLVSLRQLCLLDLIKKCLHLPSLCTFLNVCCHCCVCQKHKDKESQFSPLTSGVL